jgi:hypothetical protein
MLIPMHKRTAGISATHEKTRMGAMDSPCIVSFLTVVRSGYALAESSDAPPRVALCEVLAHPAEYSGKTMTMTARITATKEGSFLWSPSCRNLGLTLQIEDQAKSDTGIQSLLEMLRRHGLSDHPVTATLTGVFLYNQQDEYRNRRRSVFRVSAATEIKQAVGGWSTSPLIQKN